MTAMLAQMNPQTVLLKFQDIATASQKVVSTDIPQGDLGTLTDLALKARSEKVGSVQFVPPLIRPAYPDYGLIRSTVASALEPVDEDAEPAPARSTTAAAPTSSDTASDAAGSDAAESDAAAPSASGAPAASTEAVDAKSVCSVG
jgi:hypothetical protein